MNRKTRWLVAFGATVACFAVSLWVSETLILPLWVKNESDRWVIASSIGVALAALAGLWGADFAQAENERDLKISDQDKNGTGSRASQIHIKAKAEGNSKINQAGGNQIINDR